MVMRTGLFGRKVHSTFQLIKELYIISMLSVKCKSFSSSFILQVPKHIVGKLFDKFPNFIWYKSLALFFISVY